MSRRILLTGSMSAITVFVFQAVFAAEFTPQLTEYGHPDFQNIWLYNTATPFERAEGVGSLIVARDRAVQIAADGIAELPDVEDPDVSNFSSPNPMQVRGEYRSSIVILPENGLVPYTDTALAIATEILATWDTLADHPEQRALAERCLSNWGFPPMRALPFDFFSQILQTEDHVVMIREDTPGTRIIHLDDDPPAEIIPTFMGYSQGHWEGNTLVVESTNFRPIANLRGPGSRAPQTTQRRVVERYTIVDAETLRYELRTDDPGTYEEAWTVAFNYKRDDDYQQYEYACHEGNYSVPNSLGGARAEELD